MDELIERIRKRIEEIGDCWEWRGALQTNAPTPAIHWKGKVKPVRRVLAEERGMPLQGRLVTCKCRNPLCVNPDHLTLVTRKRLQEMVASEIKYQANPARQKKLADKARAKAKLTEEQAQAIRNSEGVQKQIAKDFGVSQSTVSCIKRGLTWRDYGNPFAALLKGKK